jgi:LysM repeat protein
MKIRPLISALSIVSLGFVGVSCKSTKTAKGGQDDGAYVGSNNTSGEYDNVYEMGGGDVYDTYSSEPDSSNTSSYNYESNDYSSNTTPSPAPTKPAYTPAPSKPTYTAPTPAPAPTSSRSSHTVQRGDTLFNISRRYGTSVAAIQNANGLNGDLIRIGETLRIP